MSILCRLGMHKWGKVNSQHQFGSNVIDYLDIVPVMDVMEMM